MSYLSHQTAIDVRLFQYNREALQEARDARPKNTNRAYGKRQMEWKGFCTRVGFPDGELVTENKLLWFLREEVIDREMHDSRYRKARTDSQGELIKQTIGRSSVLSYVAAIVDLWSFQSSSGINKHPNPRGEAVKAILRQAQRNESVRRRTQFVDRAAGTLQDMFDERKMAEIVRCCWKEERRESVEGYLRTATDFLFSHSMLLRGENRRTLELPDLFALELENEGPTPCIAMVMIMDNGKTNSYGRIEYAAVVRHKDYMLCTLSHLAFYFFYRWELVRESPPRFWKRQQWYPSHVFKGANCLKPLSYETQLEWTNKIFNAAGLNSLKKTHSGRTNGAKRAELNGTTEAQIRRAGRWNSDSLSSCYLTHIPRDFVRGMAGFEPSKPGSFFIPRAKVLPPQSLVRSIWPWIDDWLAWFDGGPLPEFEAKAQAGETHLDTEHDRTDLAAQGFLRLLVQLRTILLQDSVLLRREFPSHPMWSHAVFAREDYRQFEAELLVSLSSVRDPEEVQLQNVVPLLASRLTLVQQSLAQLIRDLTSKTDLRHDELRTIFDDFLRDGMTLRLQPASRAYAEETFVTPPESPSSASEADASPAPLAYEHAESAPNDQPPLVYYRLSRTIESVHDLWREWTVGLGGNPSVQSLEDAYGAKWRPSQPERVFFGRRKVIVDWIRTQQAVRGVSIGSVVADLEHVRLRNSWSLYRLAQSLKQRDVAD